MTAPSSSVPLARLLGGVVALLGALALPHAAARAQAPADATLCPPPPRKLTFAISATGATRKPVRRKPAVAAKPRAARPRTAAVVRRPAAVGATVAKRPRKHPAPQKSIVPAPRPSGPAKVAKATAVCKPWKAELPEPLVGMVATAEQGTTEIALLGAVPYPFLPVPEAEDDSSSVAPFWWMLPAGGIAVIGATHGGGAGGEGSGVAGVSVSRPPELVPPVMGPSDTPGTPGSGTPSDGPPGPTDEPGDTPGTPPTDGGEPPFTPLPPPPPVGSTTPPGGGGSGFPPPNGPPDAPPFLPPGPPSVPPTPPVKPPTEEPPTVRTAVVPEPTPLGLLLVGGGLLSLVGWSVARRW